MVGSVSTLWIFHCSLAPDSEISSPLANNSQNHRWPTIPKIRGNLDMRDLREDELSRVYGGGDGCNYSKQNQSKQNQSKQNQSKQNHSKQNYSKQNQSKGNFC